MTTEVTQITEGAAQFVIGGGHSEVMVRFRDIEGPSPIPSSAEVGVINHKGDLTIEIPSFDTGPALLIEVHPDHQISVSVQVIRPLP